MMVNDRNPGSGATNSGRRAVRQPGRHRKRHAPGPGNAGPLPAGERTAAPGRRRKGGARCTGRAAQEGSGAEEGPGLRKDRTAGAAMSIRIPGKPIENGAIRAWRCKTQSRTDRRGSEKERYEGRVRLRQGVARHGPAGAGRKGSGAQEGSGTGERSGAAEGPDGKKRRNDGPGGPPGKDNSAGAVGRKEARGVRGPKAAATRPVT